MTLCHEFQHNTGRQKLTRHVSYTEYSSNIPTSLLFMSTKDH